MTPQRAARYILTLQGLFPQDKTFREVLDYSHTCHAVRIEEKSYICDCLAFWHACECSHVLAAKHLDGIYDVEKYLSKIVNARIVGRPCKVRPVGYRAHMKKTEVVKEQTTRETVGYLGLTIASRFGKEGTVYVGKVIGTLVI